jgi:hypothetical protein
MDGISAYWPVVAGILGIVGMLMRISFQVGGVSQAFAKHVKDDDAIHADIEGRVRELQYRRR